MGSSTEPRSGILHGWSAGDSWCPDMEANLLRIGRVGLHLSVKDRDLTAPPSTPADGDTYIVATGGTGAWGGYDGRVAVYEATTTSWIFYAPRMGWLAVIEDETKLSLFTTSWQAGIDL